MTENISLGERIAQLRKQHNLTQEALADRLGITAQAVSKWETGITSPDISLLAQLADIFSITTDDLLGVARKAVVNTDKPASELMFRVRVLSADGDKVNVNLPFALISTLTKAGIGADGIIKMGGGNAMKNVDLDSIIKAVESGLRGEIVDIVSADGDVVKVYVE